MGWFGNAFNKVQGAVRKATVAVTKGTPLEAAGKALTKMSVKDPASLVKAAIATGQAIVSVGGAGAAGSIVAGKASNIASNASAALATPAGQMAAINALGTIAVKPATNTQAAQPAAVQRAQAAATTKVLVGASPSAVPMSSAPRAAKSADREAWFAYARQPWTLGGLF